MLTPIISFSVVFILGLTFELIKEFGGASLNVKFRIQPQTCCNGFMSFIHKKKGALDHKSGELVGENFMVGQFIEELVKTKARPAPWMEEGARNFLAQIGSHGVLWIVSTSNVFLLSNGDNQGDYGVVQKVRIERFNYIPNTIKLTRKTLKTNDN